MAGYCLLVDEEDVEKVTEELGVDNVLYVPLFDSMFVKDKFARLKMKLANDNEIFEHSIALVKVKTSGYDSRETAKRVVDSLFIGERHFKLIYDYNDAYKAGYDIVFIMSKKWTDKSSKGNSKGSSYIQDYQLKDIMDVMCDVFRKDEGMPLTLFEDYELGNIDTEEDYNTFIRKQKELIKMSELKENKENLKRFKKELQFRALSYYSQLRLYEFNEIVKLMNQSGFDMSELEGKLIDEDKLRIVLAKRIATRSMKNDIVELCKQGIMNMKEINYEL